MKPPADAGGDAVEQQIVEDMPVIVEHEEAAAPDREESAKIAAGVLAVIALVVLAWLVLTMAGVLP